MKKFIVALAALMTMFALAGCGNMDMIDTVYTYDYAIVAFPDGTTQTIDIKKWGTYEGEQIQIEAKDGTIYLTNSFNCVLVKEG